MKLISASLCIALILGISGVHGNAIAISSTNEPALTQVVLNLIAPYREQIKDWFWEISGVSYNAPKRQESRADYIGAELCLGALPLAKSLLQTNITDAFIKTVITAACVIAELAPDPSICAPTIESYANPVLYILRNKDIPVSDFCGILNPGSTELSPEISGWEVFVDDKKPHPTPRELPTNDEGLVKILQFTDIHLDISYTEGGNAECNLPICCRADTPSNTAGPDRPAGPFGDVKCALPIRALEEIYTNAKSQHSDARLIFLTGDYIHSGIWMYSETENSANIKPVTELLQATFSDPQYEIYPLTGNHETDVVNMYPPESVWADFPIEWMYKIVAAPFVSTFGGNPAELHRFHKYGYYSMKTKIDPKLRIIALNTNICYINNFWLPYDAVDTSGQLQWFSHTLNLAEKLHEQVFIIGHIHPGSGSCWPVWSNQFNRIVNRYEGIIRGQFYGHSHEQDYKITFEPGTDRPTSVSYVGGSGVTDGMNSAYNVYYADGTRADEDENVPTWEIMNHESYILNLQASNENEVASFTRILNAREDYEMNSFTNEEVHAFIRRMACNDTLFEKYRKVVAKGEDSPRYQNNICDNRNCRANILGDLFVSNSADHSNRLRFEADIKSPDYCSPKKQENGSTSLFSSLFLTIVLFFGVFLQ